MATRYYTGATTGIDTHRRRTRKPGGRPSPYAPSAPSTGYAASTTGIGTNRPSTPTGRTPSSRRTSTTQLTPSRGRGAVLERVLGTRYDSLTPEQSKLANTILATGLRMKAPAKHLLAAIQTGLVESSLTNIVGGDADSTNWRQERALGYADDWQKTGGPQNAVAAAERFFQEAASLDTGQSAAELAADVQRPREDLRYKYGDPQYTAAAPAVVSKFVGKVERLGGKIPGGSLVSGPKPPSRRALERWLPSGEWAEGDRRKVSPILLRRAVKLAKATSPLDVSSGFRSVEEQRQLYEGGTSYPVAKPGQSMHNFGAALDINLTAEQRAALGRFGLGTPVPDDPPHVELVGRAAQRSAALGYTTGGTIPGGSAGSSSIGGYGGSAAASTRGLRPQGRKGSGGALFSPFRNLTSGIATPPAPDGAPDGEVAPEDILSVLAGVKGRSKPRKRIQVG